MRQLSESENRADPNVEVIDSWEDLEAPADETNVPRSIEFLVKEPEMPPPKKEESVRIENKTTTEDPQTDRLIAAMAKLQLTMSKTEQLLKSSTNKENLSEQIQAKTETEKSKGSSNDPIASKEKSAEEIKAEREAKKKAKADAK